MYTYMCVNMETTGNWVPAFGVQTQVKLGFRTANILYRSAGLLNLQDCEAPIFVPIWQD